MRSKKFECRSWLPSHQLWIVVEILCVYVCVCMCLLRVCTCWTHTDLGWFGFVARGVKWMHVCQVCAAMFECVCVAVHKVIHWLRQTRYDMLAPHPVPMAQHTHTQTHSHTHTHNVNHKAPCPIHKPLLVPLKEVCETRLASDWAM